MNVFFTFAFNIGRVPEQYLIRSLECLINSLDFFNNDYKLIVYTNIEGLDILEDNVQIIRRSLDSILVVYPDNLWWSLSFNKLIVAKEIILAQSISPIWIDLDTIICRNVDYLSEFPSFFIQQRVNDNKLQDISKDISISTAEYIQGNIWKVDKELLNSLMDLWDRLDVKPYFDAQGLFNLAYHYHGFSSKMTILDDTYINGFEMIDEEKLEHPSVENLISALSIKDNKIIHNKSGREVQFFTFTFETLCYFFDINAFGLFTDPGIRKFFKACGYI